MAADFNLLVGAVNLARLAVLDLRWSDVGGGDPMSSNQDLNETKTVPRNRLRRLPEPLRPTSAATTGHPTARAPLQRTP